MLEIRSATNGDFDSVNKLYELVDEFHRIKHPHKFRKPEVPGRPSDYLINLMESEKSFLLVATFNEKVVGFVEAYILSAPDVPVMQKREWLQLDTIAVHSDFQGRGIGQALFDNLKNRVEQIGIKEIELGVYLFNESAIKFYERNGFKPLTMIMARTIS